MATGGRSQGVGLAEAAGRPSLLSGGVERALAVIFGVLAALWMVVLLLVPQRTFADDSYFYLMVAWNMARGMGSTFNTLMPTNGYHPLWMLLCTLVFKVIPQRPAALHGVAALIALLDGLMLLTVARVLRRVGAHLWPVAFALLLPFVFGSQLGTEGALSGLFLALLMMTTWRLVGRPPTAANAAMWSSVVAIAVLSRLDNIFIVGCVSLAVYLLPGPEARERRRLQVVFAAIPLVLWTVYVGSNVLLFHTIEPISGKLKSTGVRDHALGANLPHTALIALAVLLPSLAVVAVRRRDLFFRVVELPFAAGVLCHLLYIVFRMSSETRWTWYYTSWMLLAAVLLARACSVVLRERQALAPAVCGLAALLVALAWYGVSYRKFWKGRETRPPASFNAELHDRLGVRRMIAYDEPGLYAYYSDIEIVPIDGLMGDVAFQQELATKGIGEFVRREHIDGFMGPSTPIDQVTADGLCAHRFLSSEQFRCQPVGAGQFRLEGVTIYARMPPTDAGMLELPDRNKVYQLPGRVGVWRLEP